MNLNREILNKEFRSNAVKLMDPVQDCNSCLLVELEKMGLITEQSKKTFSICYEYAYFLKHYGTKRSKRAFFIEMEDKYGIPSEGVRWTVENNSYIVEQLSKRFGEMPQTE